MNKYILGLIFILFFKIGNTQSPVPSLQAFYTENPIQLDGVLDEEAWDSAKPSSRFWQYFPTDSVPSQLNTQIKILYNKETLYVGIYASSIGPNYVASTLKRDFRGTNNDNVSIMFDTFNDGNNAFMLGISPFGVRREAFISGGGVNFQGFNPNWDVKWKAEVKRFDKHFVAEIAIPLGSLKFNEGATSWKIQMYRFDFQTNERSIWSRVPQNQLLINMAYMGKLNFDKPLGKSKAPIAIIPYINTQQLQDRENALNDWTVKVGGDAKISIGTGMNLDLTLNPDFSNVEADDVITNLTRFEISLPEKRQFFIDNNDLFGNFGSRRDAIPFFSRRIGNAEDKEGNNIENNIIGGVRLSGKLNENWRLGVLSIQTDKDEANEIPSNNNSMLVLQKQVFQRSQLSAFWLNRQTVGSYDFLQPEDLYNRVVGLDYDLVSKDNKWQGNFFVHKSFQPNDNKGNFASEIFLTRQTREWQFGTGMVYVDKDFTSDLGFIPRKDVFKHALFATKFFYPKKGILNTHNVRLLLLHWVKTEDAIRKTDHNYRLMWNAELKNQARVETAFSNRYVFLNSDFEPTQVEGAVPIPGNTSYVFNQISGNYRSNRAKTFVWNVGFNVGSFYVGELYTLNTGVTYRFPPWASVSLNARYDGIQLPKPYSKASLWLLTPRLDVSFTKSIFWTTLVQYSSQQENLGINSRLQWRFAPLSDLFLVYNDHYFAGDFFAPRVRSINLKLTYWLNL